MLACYFTLLPPSGESSSCRIVQTVSAPVLCRQCSVTHTAGNINSGGEYKTPSTQVTLHQEGGETGLVLQTISAKNIKLRLVDS